MLTKQSWKKLSQAATTTVIGVVIVAGFGTSKASAVNFQTFKISGTFGGTFTTPNQNFPPNDPLVNGSFDGTYTVDVEQLPATKYVGLESWSINLRDSSGAIINRLYSSALPSFGVGASVAPERVSFAYGRPSPSSYQGLDLYVNNDFTGASVGRSQSVYQGLEFSPFYGIYERRFPNFTTFVTDFKSEPVPEPLTIGGIAVAGTIGLWLKRKKQA